MMGMGLVSRFGAEAERPLEQLRLFRTQTQGHGRARQHASSRWGGEFSRLAVVVRGQESSCNRRGVRTVRAVGLFSEGRGKPKRTACITSAGQQLLPRLQ